MIVLGLSGVFGHDPAACLVQDGIVVAAAGDFLIGFDENSNNSLLI